MSSAARQQLAPREHPAGTCQARGAEALCRACAAASLAISTSTFDDLVRPTLPCVQIGAKRVYPASALREWLRTHTEAPSCPAPQNPGLSSRAPTPLSGKSGGVATALHPKLSTSPDSALVKKLKKKLHGGGSAEQPAAQVLVLPRPPSRGSP